MDDSLRGVENADSYIHDICIHSNDFDNHLFVLRQTLRELKKVSIQMRPDKWVFAARSGEFLGHVISEDGRQPVSRTVEKMLLLPPEVWQELQRFLGLVNFYREYIQDMAHIAEPLYKFTRNGLQQNVF